MALDAASTLGQKPVSAEMIDRVVAQDINGLASTCTRHGYSVKVVADWVHVRPADIRSVLQGRLAASRAQEVRDAMLAAGMPLSAMGETKTEGIFLLRLATSAALC